MSSRRRDVHVVVARHEAHGSRISAVARLQGSESGPPSTSRCQAAWCCGYPPALPSRLVGGGVVS